MAVTGFQDWLASQRGQAPRATLQQGNGPYQGMTRGPAAGGAPQANGSNLGSIMGGGYGATPMGNYGGGVSTGAGAGGGIMQQLGQMLRGSPAQPIPGYTTPGIDQRNPYASATPQAMDGTGWKDGMSPQAFQVANPYYGQTGYYGNLQQVQAQMAGKAQSAGIPQGVLGVGSYTQNPTGQTPWQPDLTPQQKVDQDLASWEANRWNPK